MSLKAYGRVWAQAKRRKIKMRISRGRKLKIRIAEERRVEKGRRT